MLLLWIGLESVHNNNSSMAAVSFRFSDTDRKCLYLSVVWWLKNLLENRDNSKQMKNYCHSLYFIERKHIWWLGCDPMRIMGLSERNFSSEYNQQERIQPGDHRVHCKEYRKVNLKTLLTKPNTWKILVSSEYTWKQLLLQKHRNVAHFLLSTMYKLTSMHPHTWSKDYENQFF